MSIKIMSAVWEIEGIDSSECLVLMALADHADDNGRCYPSIARLAKRTKLSDRGVQKVISRLIEKGFVTVVPAAGQGGANVYIVTATPEPRSPLNDVHPRTRGTTPPNDVRKTPEPRSPKPSRTTNEPSLPEANASGRCAPTEAENAEFWKNARDYLSRKKVSKKAAGSFIGKVLREHGYERTVEAFRRCQREGVAEPIPWITATLTAAANQPAITPNIIRLLQAKVEEDLAYEAQRKAAR